MIVVVVVGVVVVVAFLRGGRVLSCVADVDGAPHDDAQTLTTLPNFSMDGSSAAQAAQSMETALLAAACAARSDASAELPTRDDEFGLSRSTLAWLEDALLDHEILVAIERCADDIATVLDDDFDRLSEVCQIDDVDGLRDIISRSPFHVGLVNRPVASGATPVWMATCANNTACVQALIELKATPFAHNQLGFSPLHVACELGNDAIVTALLDCVPPGESEAIVNKMTGSSTFPLFNAAQNGHVKIVKLLLDARARVNCLVLPQGTTSLNAARDSGHDDVVAVLLAAGAEDLKPASAVVPPAGSGRSLTDNSDHEDVGGRTFDGGGDEGGDGDGDDAIAFVDEDEVAGGSNSSNIVKRPNRWKRIMATLLSKKKKNKKKRERQTRKARHAALHGVYGCGANEEVHVIQQEVLRKRINWSSDFHPRFFRLLRVVVPATDNGDDTTAVADGGSRQPVQQRRQQQQQQQQQRAHGTEDEDDDYGYRDAYRDGGGGGRREANGVVMPAVVRFFVE